MWALKLTTSWSRVSSSNHFDRLTKICRCAISPRWAVSATTFYLPTSNQPATNQPTNQPTYTFRGFLRNASANYFGSKLAEWEEAERKKVKKPSAQILTSWLLQFYSKRRKILAKTKRLFEVMKMFVTLQQTYSFARVPFSASLCLFSFQTFTNLNTNLSQIFA